MKRGDALDPSSSLRRARVAKVAEGGCCDGNTSAHEASNPLPKARLDSWKSIAEYLKRSPRTVQRWHAEFGLPVHHYGGGRGPVFCYSDELDAWLLGFQEADGGAAVATDEFLAGRKAKSLDLAARAGELWELRSEDNLDAICAMYRKSIDQDPANGAAFIGIANSLVLSALAGGLRGASAYPRAAEAVERARRLGFEDPDTRCAAAWLQLNHERNWKSAREGFELVLEQQARSSHALAGRALLHIAEGNLFQAARGLRDAWSENVFASLTTAWRAWVQYLAGDYDQALAAAAEARASGESGSQISTVECFALLQSGPGGSLSNSLSESKFRRIDEIATAHPRCSALQGVLGYACAVSDKTGRARELLHNMNRMPGDCSYAMALILTALDEGHAAISCLETSYAEGSLWSLGFRFDPILQRLRDDTRMAARLRKLGPPG